MIDSFLGRSIIAFVMVCIVLSVYYTIKLVAKKRKAKDRYAQQSYATLQTLNPSEVRGDVNFFYNIPEESSISFKILDDKYNLVLEVENGDKRDGDHMLKFNSQQLPNGQYFYQLCTPNQKVTKKFKIEN